MAKSGFLQDVVYPRVGGETGMYSRLPLVGSGLSPRGRGNRFF